MGARTGAEYLASLRDGREVWLDGQRVDDVTAHPAFAGVVRTLASLYDLQHQPALRDTMTFPSPGGGEPVSRAYLMPRTQEDLRGRRRMMQVWAEAHCGMMGRTPDFVSVGVMAFAAARDFFAGGGERYARNALAIYEEARERDFAYTHALQNPQVDRSRAASEQPEEHIALTAVEETSDGVIVRGARQLATLAPFCDELLVYSYYPLREDEPQHALMFTIPIATPGLRLICRERLDLNLGAFNHPLASRFEEMDAVVIFDDVLVPWERLYCYRNVAIHNHAMQATCLRGHSTHQVVVKDLAKAEFVLGVAHLLAESIGVNSFLHVQEKLGELVTYVEMIRGCLAGAEAMARPGPGGVLMCDEGPLMSVLRLFTSFYPRMIEIIQLIGAGGLLTTPTEAEVRGPRAADIRRYFQGRTLAGPERVQLFKLAWDLAGDGFGTRQVIYERFFAGDPVRALAGRYLAYDTSHAAGMVKKLLGWG